MLSLLVVMPIILVLNTSSGITTYTFLSRISQILDFFPQAINGKVACTILSMERSKAPTVHSKVTYFVKLDSAILAILDVWVILMLA